MQFQLESCGKKMFYPPMSFLLFSIRTLLFVIKLRLLVHEKDLQLSSCVFLPFLSHRTLHLCHFWSPNMWVFPHTKRFCITSWVGVLQCNSILTHSSFRSQMQAVGTRVTHNFYPAWLPVGDPPISLPRDSVIC